MRVFITGVSCVGKTTIGRLLAELLNYRFYDLDEEIEKFFGTSIKRLQNKFLTIYSFRKEASKALVNLLQSPESQNCVIALSPGGLMSGHLQVVKKYGGIKVVLKDTPENILERITFYDIDSKRIYKKLTKKEKQLYLREIKKDITYFRKSYERADLQVNIAGQNIQQAAESVLHAVKNSEEQ